MKRWDVQDGHWVWSKAERQALARFAPDNARQWLAEPPHSANGFKLNQSREGRMELIRALYELIRGYEIGDTVRRSTPTPASRSSELRP